MGYDNRCLWWWEANVPFIIMNSRVSSSLLTRSVCNTYRTAQSYRRLPMPLGWSPSLHRNLLFTGRSTSYPILQEERMEDILPQLKLIVVLGSQYAVLAKNVNGVNDEICAKLRAVMLCLLEGWTASSNVGAALIRNASRKGKMKQENSIPRFLRSRMVAKN